MSGAKVCVYGAGAIGGVIAARLASAGVETSVVARGPHLDAIRENGLRVDSPESIPVAKIAASDDPAALGPQDLVIAAVKAHQLPGIVDGLRTLLRADTPIVYAINGVPWWYFHGVGGRREGKRLGRLDPGGRLWDEIGVDRTIGCVVNLGASVSSPGVVDNQGGSKLLALGELDGRQSPRLAEIVGLLRKGGFIVDTNRPIRHYVWAKLARNMTAAPVAVLASAPPAKAICDPVVRAIAQRICAEVCAIGTAYGAPPLNAAGILATLSSHRPSLLRDLDSGRPMEIDPLLTVPLELAHEAGVAVPTLEMVSGLVRARARSAGLYGG
jgi:2-dehydropantoate 2-reductase